MCVCMFKQQCLREKSICYSYAIVLLQLSGLSHETTTPKCSITTSFRCNYICQLPQRTFGACECRLECEDFVTAELYHHLLDFKKYSIYSVKNSSLATLITVPWSKAFLKYLFRYPCSSLFIKFHENWTSSFSPDAEDQKQPLWQR